MAPTNKKQKDVIVNAELEIGESRFDFTSCIEDALEHAHAELFELQETIDSLDALKPQCDKIDYALAASSGALCGLIDIFLVGAPGESPLGDITDTWFTNRTRDFAKMCGWKGGNDKSAIGFLERKFRVPYDQRGAGDAGRAIADMNPSNHHFKSLAHNPSLLGLFFSILDQFSNSSHFIGADVFSEGGELTLITLEQADDRFELRGHNVPSKFFCAFANWFGHLMSDVAGASGSKGRGSGIPSPLWTWINDIIAIKSKLGIPVSEFDTSFYNLAMEIYKQGYDTRFQTAQAIPVLINELVVRLIYLIRRLFRYFKETNTAERSFKAAWGACNPFGNPTIRRMLTVAHGVFCVIDVGDATIRGFAKGDGMFNPVEFVLRLNIIGVGRFAISLYGEAKDGVKYWYAKQDAKFAEKEKTIIKDYIKGLEILSQKYDDAELKEFIVQLRDGKQIEDAFQKSVILAEKRDVPNPLRTKNEIDNYFNPSKK